jgi:hypothetical protein
MSDTLVPPAQSGDDDDVVLALETARVEEERGEHGEAARWVQRAAGAARKQGRPNRAGELSRVQAMLTDVASKFQKAPSLEHVLDSDDDFTEHTIVDRPPSLSEPEAPTPQRASAPPPPPRPQEEPSRPRQESTKAAALADAAHAAVRVGVRKTTTGLEVRVLKDGEALQAREDEALLVPLRPGTRWV